MEVCLEKLLGLPPPPPPLPLDYKVQLNYYVKAYFDCSCLINSLQRLKERGPFMKCQSAQGLSGNC